jgi:hypothetical protein
MGANDRESLAAHSSRPYSRTAHHEEDEEEDQGPSRRPPPRRAPRTALRNRLSRTDDRSGIGGTPDPIAELSEADCFRSMEPHRPPRRPHLAVTPPIHRLVACSRRRWPRRLRPMPGRTVLPSDRRRLLRRRADPDPVRRRRRSGVGKRVGRRNLFTRRDRRLPLRLGRRGRRRIGLRNGRRRRGSRRSDGRRGRSGGIRCGRRLGQGRGVGSATRRKELKGVDVRLGVTDPDAEVHVGHGVLRLPSRTGLPHRVPFRDRLAATDVQLPEVRQRRLVVARRDRDRQAVGGDRTGEGHCAGHGRAERESSAEPDVDATMLPGRIRVSAHGEPAQYRTVCGPRPRPRGRAHGKRADNTGSESCKQSRCLGSEHESTVATADAGDNAKLTSCYREPR